MLERSAAEAVACKSGRGPSGPSEALLDRAFRCGIGALAPLAELKGRARGSAPGVGGRGINQQLFYATFNPLDEIRGVVNIVL